MLTLILCAIAFQDFDRGICPEDYRRLEGDLVGRIRSADLEPITKEIERLRASKAPTYLDLLRLDMKLKFVERDSYLRDRGAAGECTVENVEAQFLLAKCWSEIAEIAGVVPADARRHDVNAWEGCFTVLGSIRRQKMPDARKYILRSAALEGAGRLARQKDAKVNYQSEIAKLVDECAPTDAEIGESVDAFMICLNRALSLESDHPASAALAFVRLVELREFSTSEVVPKPEGLAAAVERLHSEAIEERDAASAAIAKMGRAAERTLWKLVWSPNAEVRARAQGLLVRLSLPEHEAKWWEGIDRLVGDNDQVLYSELTDLLTAISKRDPSAIHRPAIVRYLLKRLENHVDQVEVHYLLRKISGKRFNIDDNKWEEWLKFE